MRTIHVASFLIVLSVGVMPALAATKDTKQARSVISHKCTACHSAEKIDAALKAGKDMTAIQKEMEKKGAKLSSNERDVLGIYWKQNPLKQN